MPTIEGKQAGVWINDYVKNAGKSEGVAKAVRALVKKGVKGVEEYVNPWKIPSFDSNGPLCGTCQESCVGGIHAAASKRD